MFEAKNIQYELIPRDFKGNKINFFKQEEKIWISSSAIARGLDLDRTNISQSYFRNKQLLESHTTVIPIITEKGSRDTRVFDRTGFIWICVRSNSPNALPFQEWVLNVIDEVLNKGYYIETPKNQFALQITSLHSKLDILLNLFEGYSQIRSDIEDLKAKTKNIFVTPETRKLIRDEVHRVATQYYSGNHHKIWSSIKRRYSVNRYEELKEENAREVIDILKTKLPDKHQAQLNYKNQKRGGN